MGRFSVDIDGEATRLVLEAVKAKIQFREIHLQQGKFEVQQAEPTVLALNNAQLRVERWQWKGPQTQLSVAGAAGLAGEQRLDLQASGNVDASVTAFFVPSLQVSGVTQVGFKAGGTLRDPSLSGFLDLAEGSVGMRSPRILADDLKVRVELAGRRVEIRNLTGRLNGGSIQGGGGIVNGGLTTLSNCTVSSNTAEDGGGAGIWNWNTGVLTANHCTITGNRCLGAGGGSGGGVENLGTCNASNTIIGGNQAVVGSSGNDVYGTLTSQGYNLIQDTNDMTLTGNTTGNLLGVDPLLGPLQDNGGSTFTHALLPGSPAIDQGSAGGLATDQRGVSRPVDDLTIPNAADGSDIGAFELETVNLPVPPGIVQQPVSVTNERRASAQPIF
jgi:hypothetical protein